MKPRVLNDFVSYDRTTKNILHVARIIDTRNNRRAYIRWSMGRFNGCNVTSARDYQARVIGGAK